MVVDVTVGDMVEIGVIVEIAITLFPILQLARTKKDNTRNTNLFATMITSVIVSSLCLYLNIHAPNGARYWRRGGREFHSGAEKRKPEKCYFGGRIPAVQCTLCWALFRVLTINVSLPCKYTKLPIHQIEYR